MSKSTIEPQTDIETMITKNKSTNTVCSTVSFDQYQSEHLSDDLNELEFGVRIQPSSFHKAGVNEESKENDPVFQVVQMMHALVFQNRTLSKADIDHLKFML